MLENTYVLIESNYLKLIGEEFDIKVDINRLGKELAKNEKFWCKKIFYYCSPPFQSTSPTQDEINRRSGYDKFVSKIRKLGIIVREGRCQYVDGEYNEKGVDTLFTIDLMKILIHNLKNKDNNKTINKVIILACDTDFVPVIKEVQSKGIKVILYYYTDKIRGSKFSMSNNILNACSKKVLINKNILNKAEFKK